MNEIERLKDQLERSLNGNAWHGPTALELLSNVDAKKAHARPFSHAHSIWEIVLHISVWEHIGIRRLNGEPFEPTAEEDWPSITDSSDNGWKKTVANMKATHDALLEKISERTNSDLSLIVPGKSYSIYFMIHGIIQHNIYHAGQIALLKK